MALYIIIIIIQYLKYFNQITSLASAEKGVDIQYLFNMALLIASCLVYLLYQLGTGGCT